MGTVLVNRALDPNAFAPSINILANGGFEQWSVGTSFTNPSTNRFLCDGWSMQTANATAFTVSREAAIVDSEQYSLKCDVTVAGVNEFVYFQQSLPNSISYAGKTISFSIRVRTNSATKIRAAIGDGILTTQISAYHSGGGAWETLTVTMAISPSSIGVTVYVGQLSYTTDTGTVTFYLDSAMLVIGSQPLAFVPENPEVNKVKIGLFSDLPNNVTNLLTNGGFEVWQRGLTFSSPPSGYYHADGWKTLWNRTVLPTFTISREGTIVDFGSSYSLKMDVTNVGSGSYLDGRFCVQVLENLAVYKGKTITFSVRVKTTSTALNIGIADGTGASTSLNHTGDNTWQTLVITRTIGASPSYVWLYLNFDSVQVSTTYIDSAMMTFGSSLVNFVPMHPADDFKRCLRYCQKFGGGAVNQDIAIGISLSTSVCEFPIHYFVPMANVPTATVVSSTNWKTGNPAGGLVIIGALGFAAESNHSGYFGGSSVVGSPLTAFHAAELFSSTTSEYLLLEVAL